MEVSRRVSVGSGLKYILKILVILEKIVPKGKLHNKNG